MRGRVFRGGRPSADAQRAVDWPGKKRGIRVRGAAAAAAARCADASPPPRSTPPGGGRSRDGRSGAVVARRRPSPRESAPTPERVHRPPPPPSLRTFSRHSTTSFVRRVSPFSRRTARNRSGCRVNRYRFRALFSRVLSAATAAADTSESPRELSSLVYFFRTLYYFSAACSVREKYYGSKKKQIVRILIFFCDRLFYFFRFLTGKSLCRVSVKKKNSNRIIVMAVPFTPDGSPYDSPIHQLLQIEYLLKELLTLLRWTGWTAAHGKRLFLF